MSGCSAAPAQDILGSFFPAWMLCAAIGVIATVLARLVLIAVGIGDQLVLPLLTYLGFASCVTLLTWLLWFGH